MLEPFKIPSILGFVGQDLVRDRKLCPVCSIKSYLVHSQDRHQSKKQMFISHQKEHKEDIHKTPSVDEFTNSSYIFTGTPQRLPY